MASTKLVAASFCGGLVLGVGGTYFYVKTLQPTIRKGPVTETRHAVDMGIPETEVIRAYEGYTAAFDYRTKNPKWVLEHITAESSNGTAERKGSDFFEDKSIPFWLRARLAAYHASGYDRGHLAPAADHKGSQTAMNETFCLNNISPQVGEGFNRDYWARFEKFVKDCTRKCKDVFVVTGPLWMPTLDDKGKWSMRYPLIGNAPDLVSVPTHFYKVVLTKGCKEPQPGSSKSNNNSKADIGVAAFVMPNAPIDPTTPLSAFVVPLQPLESVAGTRFFPSYLTQERMEYVDHLAQDVREAGLSRMKYLDRQAVLDAVPQRLALAQPAETSVELTTSPSTASDLGSAVSLSSASSLDRATSINSIGSVSGNSSPGSISSASSTVGSTGGTVLPAPAPTTAAGKLTGVSQSSSAAVKDAQAASKKDALVPSQPAPVIRPVGGRNYTHLCDIVACSLPPERFWERDGGSSSSSNGRRGGGGRGGANRALTRR